MGTFNAKSVGQVLTQVNTQLRTKEIYVEGRVTVRTFKIVSIVNSTWAPRFSSKPHFLEVLRKNTVRDQI